MIRVTGHYYWEEGAHFDHKYYNSEHMVFTKELLNPHGLIRLESDRFLSQAAPAPGQIIAATNAYFPSLEAAQTAMMVAGPKLMADLSNYTNLTPRILFSKVTAHE